MLYRTHFLGGLAAGLLVAGQVDPKSALISAGVAGVAALLPDLDTPQSELGRHLKFISEPTKMIFRHRGALHSILAAFGLSMLLLPFLLHHQYNFLYMPVLIGYLSHLALDALNPEGVPFLWPLHTKFKIPLVKTGGILEHLIVAPALLLLVAWMAWPLVHQII